MNIPRLQRRADLLTSRISLGKRSVWVVKDPLSQAFHFFDDAEYGILRSLDDRRTFAELVRSYRGRVDATGLAQFLAAATRAGLVTTPDGVPASLAWRPVAARPRPSWWHQPLAIRLPGITPSGLFPTGRHFPRGLLVGLASLMLAAVLIVGFRCEEFVSEFSNASLRVYASLISSSGLMAAKNISGTLLGFAIAVMITKVIHELAHAWVCTRLGGRCREMGVLLLLGVPCLYCDVSDAWLLPRRRDRVLVSAAGMIAECVIASLAVFVWSITQPGALHDLATLIVVVASVSTVLVNANPLLRYDGYYILSDWVGVPNLSAAASAEVREFFARILVSPQNRRPGPALNLGLLGYGLCSGLYRTLVLGVILWAVYSFIESWIGIGIALPVTFWLAFILLRGRFLRRPRVERDGSPAAINSTASSPRVRRHVVPILIAVFLVVAVLTPLPNSLRVAALIRPTGERPLYAATSGMLVAIDPRSKVPRLDDWRIQLQAEVALGRVAELRAEQAAARIDRLERPSLSLLQPILQDQLASAEEQHATIAKRVHELDISLDRQSTIFAPPRRRISDWERAAGRSTWSGVPVREANLGATLESGTLLGRVGHRTRRSVSLFVSEQSIGSLGVGASVTLGYRSLPSGTLRAEVVSVSTDPVDELPEEILSSGWGHGAQRRGGHSGGDEIYYEVIAALAEPDAPAIVLPSRLVTPARIRLPSSSLLTRWRQWMSENF